MKAYKFNSRKLAQSFALVRGDKMLKSSIRTSEQFVQEAIDYFSDALNGDDASRAGDIVEVLDESNKSVADYSIEDIRELLV